MAYNDARGSIIGLGKEKPRGSGVERDEKHDSLNSNNVSYETVIRKAERNLDLATIWMWEHAKPTTLLAACCGIGKGHRDISWEAWILTRGEEALRRLRGGL